MVTISHYRRLVIANHSSVQVKVIAQLTNVIISKS